KSNHYAQDRYQLERLSLLLQLAARPHFLFWRFYVNVPATSAIYTLSLHDALPIWRRRCRSRSPQPAGTSSGAGAPVRADSARSPDRKSTRLNSSHRTISYAVVCLKKKSEPVRGWIPETFDVAI